jgi:hypothetical protein
MASAADKFRIFGDDPDVNSAIVLINLAPKLQLAIAWFSRPSPLPFR